MKDAQKPDRVSLNTLVSRLNEGRFVIPDFQREFEWKPWDINDLMRSIFLDYYIGSLLLWRGKKENFDALSCEVIYGFKDASKHHDWKYENSRAEHIVLDGQQRLTAIYYSIFAPDVPLPNRSTKAYYFINIDSYIDEDYDDAFRYEWECKHTRKMVQDENYQYKNHIFPISVIGKGGWSLPNWIQGYEKYWETELEKAKENGDTVYEDKCIINLNNSRKFAKEIKDLTEQYHISYIELDKDLEVDKVCDIFTKINSKGIRLDVFDLINALLKPKGLQLKHMWREAAPRLEHVEASKMNVYILQVMSILSQSYCSPKYLYYLLPGQEKKIRHHDGSHDKEVLIKDTQDFEKQWEKAVETLEKSIKLLFNPGDYGALSSNYLPYVAIIPIFAALQSYVETLAQTKKLDAQRKIKQWYWASVFTNRYSGSVESTIARDFMDMKNWIKDSTAEPIPVIEFKQQFKNIELRKETRRGTSVYNGIFNLLVLQGAKDWMTGLTPQYDDLHDHHIVPKSWGKEHLGGNGINTILNRTPLTSKTNGYIGKRLPNDYLTELIRNNGEEEVRKILESHFISKKAQEILLRDPFIKEDFEDFISERQRTIQDAIEYLLIKERIDLPPKLRDLDEMIESIELDLRQIIEDVLTTNNKDIPPNYTSKADERIHNTAKKNAAFDIEYYSTLTGKLEFCDFRELQSIITGKVFWDEFSHIFTNKNSLNVKFDQLAELRNCIRHSRSVDEVTQKEGEAAIHWFEQVIESYKNVR